MLATAFLAVAPSTIETARVDHAESRVTASLETLEAAAETLAAQSDPPPGTPGVVRRPTLMLPTGTWGTTAVDAVRIAGDALATVRWRVEGGPNGSGGSRNRS